MTLDAQAIELIGLAEKATGGSRELDAEIMFEAHASPVGIDPIDGGPKGYVWLGNQPTWNLGLRFPGKDKAWALNARRNMEEMLVIQRDGAIVLMNSLRVLPFTASLDAALTLLLPGHSLGELHDAAKEKDRPHVRAAVRRDEPDYAVFVGIGKTYALALCIAALKARAALHPQPDTTSEVM